MVWCTLRTAAGKMVVSLGCWLILLSTFDYFNCAAAASSKGSSFPEMGRFTDDDGQGKPLTSADIDRIESFTSLSWLQRRQILDSPDRPWGHDSSLVVDGDWMDRPLPFSSLAHEGKEHVTKFSAYDAREKTFLSDNFGHQMREEHLVKFREAVNHATETTGVPRIGTVWKQMLKDPVLKDYFNPFWLVHVYMDQVISFKGKNTREKFWPFAWQQLLANAPEWQALEQRQARHGLLEMYKELGRILAITRRELTKGELAKFMALEQQVRGLAPTESPTEAKKAAQKRIKAALAIVQREVGIRYRFDCGLMVKKPAAKAASKNSPKTARSFKSFKAPKSK